MDTNYDETAQRFTAPPSAFPETDKNLPTVDSVVEERKKQAAAKPENPVKTEKKEDGAPSAQAEEAKGNETQAAAGSPEALEEEAGQEGAFNPETGEINWDCPCLGGMAHGPCGEQFKTAFSCFVYSTEEPKGMDCIEKFQYVTTISIQRIDALANVLLQGHARMLPPIP
jgi:intermembrane space import and assembly protein 40